MVIGKARGTMIFISGIHGSGKTYFCKQVKEKLGCLTYSASKLISERKQLEFTSDKLIPDIEDNQQHLLSAINELNAINPVYLLDGHFCLLNGEGKITRIEQSTFISLNPEALVLITEEPEIIVKRLNERDGTKRDKNEILLFQEEESAYATELSVLLGIPLHIYNESNDLNNTLEFIQVQMRRIQDAR